MTLTMDSANHPDPRGDAVPLPPRFWWLKRLSIAGVALIVGLFLLRIWWGYEANRRLQAQIEEYRAAGQLVDVEEFNAQLDAVPDDQNAALLYERAIERHVVSGKFGLSVRAFVNNPTWFEVNPVEAGELMAANAETLRLIREARDRPQNAWRERLDAPLDGMLPHSELRDLAYLLRFAATYHFRVGDHAGTVESLRDALRLSAAIDGHPNVSSSLVARACLELALGVVTELGATLQIDQTGVHGPTVKRAATRNQIQALTNELLDDAPARRAAIASRFGSRAQHIRAFETLSWSDWLPPNAFFRYQESPYRHPLGARLAYPIVILEARRGRRYHTIATRALSETNWPQAKSHFSRGSPEPDLLDRLVRPITRNVFGDSYLLTRSSVQGFFRTLAKRRLAAVALAVHLHTAEHGRRPERLAVLVPDYLPALPQDPFTMATTSFGYKPTGKRALLYSVGPDGRDNGGAIVKAPDGRRDVEKSDIVFYLDSEPTLDKGRVRLGDWPPPGKERGG